MYTEAKTIEVSTILFESNDPEVLLKGTVSKGFMTFDTDVIISHTQLNQLMNQLQKQNQSLEYDTLLTSEKMYNDETLYTANFTSDLNRSVNLEELMFSESLKQIRA